MITKTALDGIKIVDLSRMAPGPFCSMMLGDMGADVIKVDAPPTARIIANKTSNDPQNRKIAATNPLNRNKRSIILDLKKEVGIEVLHQICRDADIFIEDDKYLLNICCKLWIYQVFRLCYMHKFALIFKKVKNRKMCCLFSVSF